MYASFRGVVEDRVLAPLSDDEHGQSGLHVCTSSERPHRRTESIPLGRPFGEGGLERWQRGWPPGFEPVQGDVLALLAVVGGDELGRRHALLHGQAWVGHHLVEGHDRRHMRQIARWEPELLQVGGNVVVVCLVQTLLARPRARPDRCASTAGAAWSDEGPSADGAGQGSRARSRCPNGPAAEASRTHVR